jgi:hypothetical protein
MNKGNYFILPDQSIMQKIKETLDNTNSLRKWVGNKLIYQSAKKWTEVLQSNNHNIIELSESHEILVYWMPSFGGSI